jgi:hypothetical protein
MNELEKLSHLIFSKYGNVTRARGCFLYTSKNVRLTDLYQENGRAILGWGGSSAFTMFKNTLSRGITGSFLCGYEYRLEKAVSDFFASQRKVLAFNKKSDALKTALLLSSQSTHVYKPWRAAPVKWNEIDCIIFEVPLAWTPEIYLLCVKEEIKCEVQGIKLAAPFISALTKSIYNLSLALQNRQEKDWFIYDTVLTKYFKREGPYLYPKVDKNLYDEFVLHCLDQQLVINPFYEEASIVPFGADAGVFNGLKKNPFGE